MFEGGRLVAKAMDREQHQWFGGRVVPTAGVAGVAVVPERRGAGLAQTVLTHLLERARERGAVLSTLFRTTPLPYRRLGYEQVGTLRWTALATAALTGVRCPPGVTLRAATPLDVAAVREIRRSVACTTTGGMDRCGPIYDLAAAAEFDAHDGTTLAVDATGMVQGFITWDRGAGYDANAVLTVHDLVGLTADATTALLANLASWASVTPTLHLRLPEPDPAALLASFAGARVLSEDPWMMRLVDAPAAVAARGWPPHLGGGLDLDLVDDVCAWNAGAWRLEVGDSAAELTRRTTTAAADCVQLTARGAAAWYAGTSPAVLRRAGLISGGSAEDDGFLQAAAAGPPPALLDYF
jgi:predicted acetyltransferase